MISFYEKIILICPYAKTLGIQFDYDQKGIFSILPYHVHLVGNPLAKALHGGAIGSFMEITAISNLIYKTPKTEMIQQNQLAKPINLSITYLIKARLETLFARAELTKQGRRVSHINVISWQTDEHVPIATLSAHFLL